MIALSSMKAYEFDCNYEEVNVMVCKVLLIGNFKSKCINVVGIEPLGNDSKSAVEVTFDGLGKEQNAKIYTSVNKSFGCT